MASVEITKDFYFTHIEDGDSYKTDFQAFTGNSGYKAEEELHRGFLWVPDTNNDGIVESDHIKKIDLSFDMKNNALIPSLTTKTVKAGWGYGSVKWYPAAECYIEQTANSYYTYNKTPSSKSGPASSIVYSYCPTVSSNSSDFISKKITLYDGTGGYTTLNSMSTFTPTSTTNWSPRRGFLVFLYLQSSTIIKNLKLIITYEVDGANVNLSASPSNGGIVSGGGEYPQGTNVTITATPNTGYQFVEWINDDSGNLISTNNPYSFTVQTTDKNYTAIFESLSYTITAQSNNTSYGTVSNSGGTYSYNSTFTSTATPNTNYQFDGWYKNGSLVTSSAQLSVTVSGDATYTAQFSRKQYTVTYISDGTSTPSPQVFYAGDSVTLAPAVSKDNTTINSSNDFSTTFNPQNGIWSDGSTSSKSVNPKKVTSYTFRYWYDGSTNYQAGYSYTLSGDKIFTATWSQSHSYTIIAPTISRNNSTASREIKFYYNDGTNDKSTAISSNTTSYTFKGWYNNTSGGSVKISSNGGSYHPSSRETLYAQWNSSSTGYSKVTFPTFTRDGYTLVGFASSSSATSKDYEAGQEAVVEIVDWYAIWEPDILTISLNNKNATANGTSTLYLKYDTGWYSNSLATTSISKITVPKRTGYTFQGYYTKENGEGTKIIDNTGAIVGAKNFTSNKNIILYVYWTINYYSFDDNINSKGEEGLFDGNGYAKTLKSGNKNNNTYSYGSVITLSATPNTSNAYDFLYWEINGNPITSNPYDLTITQNTTVIAYFGLKGMSITVNLYKDNKPFTIPIGEENSYIRLWMRELKSDNTYSEWQRKPFNTKLTYSSEKVTNIQAVIQDGEDYEFDSGTLPQYEIIKINGDLSYSVYCKQIPVINNIYFGKSNKPYTSGYIKDPNLSFEEEISSIWVGNKQIMGKVPTREYPYLEDTLLGNILYVGKNNNFIDSSTNNYRNNLNIYKVIIPEGITHTGSYGFLGCSNLTSVILPKSLITLGTHAFEGTGLKSLYLSKNIETVTTRALCSINNLEKITFSNNLKAIYANNLSGSKITTINFLKTNLETIGSSAFNGTSYLTTVLLPNTLITIGANAFDYDFNLTKIIYNGTVEQWNNILIETTGNECLLNATIYCKDGVINPKEEN